MGIPSAAEQPDAEEASRAPGCRPLSPLCSSHHIWAAPLFDGGRLKGLSHCEVLALMWQPGRSSRIEGSGVACGENMSLLGSMDNHSNKSLSFRFLMCKK